MASVKPPRAILDNPRSDRVRLVRALTRRSVRTERGKFLVEGPQAAREAAVAGALVDLYVATAAGERHPEIAFEADARGCFVHEVTDDVAQAMSADGQGFIGIARIPEISLSDAAFSPRDSRGTAQSIAIFFEIRDPGNAGTAIRAADASGASGVVFSENSVDPLSEKVVRSSAGSIFHVPVFAGSEPRELVARFRAQGWRVLAADGHGEHGLFGCEGLDEPTAWLFGNEARGLPRELVAACNASVNIPLVGGAESLNLAMAATLCLFESARARMGQRR